jgi:hypothetical protein
MQHTVDCAIFIAQLLSGSLHLPSGNAGVQIAQDSVEPVQLGDECRMHGLAAAQAVASVLWGLRLAPRADAGVGSAHILRLSPATGTY